MTRNHLQDETECVRQLVKYLSKVTPHLVEGFHTERNKIRYLRNAVLGKQCATTPWKKISTARYTVDQLVMALNERIQFEQDSCLQ